MFKKDIAIHVSILLLGPLLPFLIFERLLDSRVGKFKAGFWEFWGMEWFVMVRASSERELNPSGNQFGVVVFEGKCGFDQGIVALLKL